MCALLPSVLSRKSEVVSSVPVAPIGTRPQPGMILQEAQGDTR